MITVTFTCDICKNSETHELHGGYQMPDFFNKDVCRLCYLDAIAEAKKQYKG